MEKLENISDKIIELITEGEITEELFFFENWMSEQLKRIKEFKQKSKPLFYNQEIFEAICHDSELIIGFDFSIIKDTGFFSYLLTVRKNEYPPYNFLNFVKETYRAEFMIFLKSNETTSYDFLFETRIQTYDLVEFKVIFKIKTLNEKQQFIITIKNIKPEEEYQRQAFGGFQDKNNLEQSGISLLLFGNNYNIIDHAGCEVLIPKNKISNTLFDSFDLDQTKRIYPFINRALKGSFNSGEVRIKGNVFNVYAFPVKDQNGFTNSTVLLIKNFF
ncbi:hypothetical protein GM418_29655 [Maribellus comscasis]|uniref:Uncharacterized protein n=1 Tax=Maribellus comscasis TaxID=2681766 RepID=A0A6I6K5F1_9BACT|nr:hypothetical protein [Maribellus comscasis]QGY47682.1 hypothetical protein GM418_29655 [Maribellus comscasis]